MIVYHGRRQFPVNVKQYCNKKNLVNLFPNLGWFLSQLSSISHFIRPTFFLILSQRPAVKNWFDDDPDGNEMSDLLLGNDPPNQLSATTGQNSRNDY
jgi:hypothetical protein